MRIFSEAVTQLEAHEKIAKVYLYWAMGQTEKIEAGMK